MTRKSLEYLLQWNNFGSKLWNGTNYMVGAVRPIPSVYDWVRRLEDSSGIEGEWHDFADMRGAVSELLKFSAHYYLPFLKANANAHAEGADAMSVDLAGRTFEQPTFKYQVKCYDRLRKLLQNEQTDALRELLAETGCLQCLE